jgi:ATP-dependent helicase/DNAse subunit B
MGLSLVVGPANAGKVALLLERYLARLDDEPFLIVPNRSDVDRIERDLLALRRCLLGGAIGTFDDLFERLAGEGPATVRPVGPAQRVLVVRRAVDEVLRSSDPLRLAASSARSAGFADTLLSALGELESGLLDASDLDGDLATLYGAYRRQLDRLGLCDRDLLRRLAVERLQNELAAWRGEPVFAYGFEDLTAAEWSLLEALAGRAEVEVTLPYEPGRIAFASLRRTAEDLAALADGRTTELPPRSSEYTAPALAHLERTLFDEPVPDSSVAPDGAVRFLEGAGTRDTLELVAEEVLRLLHEGIAAEQIGLVVPAAERFRAPLETVLTGFAIPYALEARRRLGSTPLGFSLCSLLRFAWAGAGRRELFVFLRSPYSGIARSSVDYVEGRLRGRAVESPDRVVEEAEKLREAPLPALHDLRAASDPVDAVRTLLSAMLTSAYGLDAPPAGESSRLDLRCLGAATRVLDELEGWQRLGEPLTHEELIAALERAEVAAPAVEPGRVAVLDLLRARTRRFQAVFLLGLEEGSLPRRDRGSPFLDDDRRRALGARLERPDPVSRDRYLFYTACTRAADRLYLVREAAGDDGSPREASPFWHEVAGVFDLEQVRRATSRRPLSQLTWPLESAPTERERLRALARLGADPAQEDLADALAAANDWSRRLDRARRAFDRDVRLRNPAVLATLADRSMFGVTELERFVDCSSAWLVERVVDPKTIDAEADALVRGKVAHQALYAFYSGLPKEVGADRVGDDNLEPALAFLERCLDDALRGGVRLELGEVEAAELRESLRRDLERFVRDEARSEVGLLPRRFEVSFGSDRSAPELQRGLALGDGLFVGGKIDRIDVDPFSASGIVQDYKSGKGSHSARQIEDEGRLQVPLYMLVLRDLVGIEPLGGVYRALAGSRGARGMLRRDAHGELPGFADRDYLGEAEFWQQVESARVRALGAARRIRAGDVAHDPRGGDCPSWCDLWTICRVSRA